MQKTLNFFSYILLITTTVFLLVVSCENDIVGYDEYGSISLSIQFSSGSRSNFFGTDPVFFQNQKKLHFPRQNENLEIIPVGNSILPNQGYVISHTLEKTTGSSLNIEMVTITITDIEPIDIFISSGMVTKTIDNIPIGEKTITIDLKDSEGVILYTESQEVTIKPGKTAQLIFRNFTVLNESVEITSPNGGTTWLLGEKHMITWNRTHPENDVKIELYKTGILYSRIINSTSNDGSYDWAIATTYDAGNDYKIMVTSTSNPDAYDFSDSYFALFLPDLSVIDVSVMPTAVAPDSAVTIGFTLINSGTYSVSSATVSYYLSTSSSDYSTGLLLGTENLNSPIPAGTSSWSQPDYPIPSSVSEGDYYLFVILNYGDANQTNNYNYSSLRVVSACGDFSWEDDYFTTSDLDDWGVGSYGNYSTTDGKLVIQGEGDEYYHWFYRYMRDMSTWIYLKEPFTFEAGTEVMATESEYWTYGLAIRTADDYRYFLDIDPVFKEYRFLRLPIGGDWETLIVWTPLPSTWNDISNDIGITYDGTKFEIVLNDVAVNTFNVSGVQLRVFYLSQQLTGTIGFTHVNVCGTGTTGLQAAGLLQTTRPEKAVISKPRSK